MRNPKARLVSLLSLIIAFSFTLQALYSQSAETLLQAAHTANNNGNYDLALSLYQKSIDAGANRAVAWYNMGNANYRKGEILKAIEFYQKTSVAAPAFKNAFLNLAKIYFTLDGYSDSLEILFKYIKLNGDDEETLVLIGNVYKQIREYDLAEKYFIKARDLVPEYEDAYIELAWLYYDLDDLKHSTRFLEEGIKNIPSSVLLREQYASFLTEAKEYKKAVSLYNELINFQSIEPERKYLIKCEMAKNMLLGGLTNTALDMMMQTVDESPKQGKGIAILNTMFLETERIFEAYNFYYKFFDKNPKESYIAMKDLFRFAVNKDNKAYIRLFLAFYEERKLVDDLYLYVKENI